MKSMTQAYTDSYIKINGQNVPINLAPSGIKCIDCGKYYPSSQLQQHLTTHVNPQFVKLAPMNEISKIDKLKLANHLQDPEKLQEIWVKSFLPSDLPQIQKQKKVAAKLGGEHSILKNLVFQGLNQIKPLNNDLVSSIGETSQTFETESQLNIRKNIKLTKVTNPIDRKQLHVYMNERGITTNVDNNVAKSKTARDQQTQASDGYSVMQAPTVYKDNAPQTPRKQNRQTYNIKSGLKNPGNPLIISTASKPPGLAVSQTKQYSPRSTILDGSSQRPEPRAHNHTCPCCRGFYCSQCKSSVPPIYRPVPDQQGKYHFHPEQNQRSIQFYQSHYYPRQDINVCTGCQKRMELNRMVPSRREQGSRSP